MMSGPLWPQRPRAHELIPPSRRPPLGPHGGDRSVGRGARVRARRPSRARRCSRSGPERGRAPWPGPAPPPRPAPDPVPGRRWGAVARARGPRGGREPPRAPRPLQGARRRQREPRGSRRGARAILPLPPSGVRGAGFGGPAMCGDGGRPKAKEDGGPRPAPMKHIRESFKTIKLPFFFASFYFGKYVS